MEWNDWMLAARDHIPFAAAVTGHVTAEPRPMFTRILESGFVAVAGGLVAMYGMQQKTDAEMIAIHSRLHELHMRMDVLQRDGSVPTREVQVSLGHLDRRLQRIEAQLDARIDARSRRPTSE